MFTKQTGMLERLRGLIPNADGVIDVLKSTYHNCAQKLFHRAPVEIAVDGAKEHVPDRAEGAPWFQLYGALNVANHSAYYDRTNNEFINGVTLNIEGPVNIQPSTYVQNNSTTFQDTYNIALTLIDCSLYVTENVYVNTIYDITQTTSITINSTTVTINNSLTVNNTITTVNLTTTGTLSLDGLTFT